MKITRYFYAAFCAALLTCTTNANACKIGPNRISSYFKIGGVVFIGKVVSVKPMESEVEGVSKQDIRFSVSEWISDKSHVRNEWLEEIHVFGIKTDVNHDPCFGHNNFSAKEGEEWLIFGKIHNPEGWVFPNDSLSEKIHD